MRPGRRAGTVAASLVVSVLAAACSSSGPPSHQAASSAVRPSSSPRVSRTASTSAVKSAPPLAHPLIRGGLSVPDPQVTPGSVVRGVSAAQVCARGYTAKHNDIGYVVRNEVSARYGVVAGPGTSLHLDQLIPAGLGGDATIRNVWPQPEAQLKKKNGLEAHLHALVCQGSLSLSTAQRVIADDWPAALRAYPPT